LQGGLAAQLHGMKQGSSSSSSKGQSSPRVFFDKPRKGYCSEALHSFHAWPPKLFIPCSRSGHSVLCPPYTNLPRRAASSSEEGALLDAAVSSARFSASRTPWQGKGDC